MKQKLEVLKSLSSNAQLVFAYLSCERLFPNYKYFSHNFHFGNPAILREGIDYIKSYLKTHELDLIRINSLMNALEKQIPYPEDFDTILASSALDACAVLDESFSFLLDEQFTRIEVISNAATDTVYMHVQDILDLSYENPDFENIIQAHPLMQKEMEVQQHIVSYLSDVKTITDADIAKLVDNQAQNGNIGLPA